MNSSSSLKRANMAPEEQLLLREMHMKNSITINSSKQTNRYGDKKYAEPVRLTPAWEEKNLPNDVLNFKNVTMEKAELETNPPKDRWLIVYLIILLHGIGVLMPWNMFITAKEYFEDYKLSPNYTHVDTKAFQDDFMPFLGVFSQAPNFIFNWINVFASVSGSLTTRIVYSISVEVLLFIATETLVLVDSSAWPGLFFWMTMGIVFVLNVANGIYQNTIYGVAARLPPKYTGAIILGNNLSGIFVVLIGIVTKRFTSSLKTAAVYYFIVALFVLFICFDTYFVLPLLNFYKYHNLQFEKAQEKAKLAADEARVKHKTPYWKIFKQCSLQCFNVFFLFFVTLMIFPSVHSEVKRSNSDFFITNEYFTLLTCFLTFSTSAAIGNVIAGIFQWPSPKYLHFPVLLRAAFVPLFLIMNYQVEGRIMPVLIFNDYAYWGVAMLFGLTSGYYSSLAMMYCGKAVAPEYSSVAGMLGAACLITGICGGLMATFILPFAVKKISW